MQGERLDRWLMRLLAARHEFCPAMHLHPHDTPQARTVMELFTLALLSSARISSTWDRVRTSYWFMPTVGSFLAAAASALLLRLDHAVAGTLPADAWWLYGGDADGARALMATIIGSMITVISVVFSITIVTLTLASAQFGSRLLRMFMRDRGNQLVLAVFIATFVYSLLVMRSVRGTDDVQFVPYLSVTLAVVLVLSSVGLLIYFIHHVSMSIQVDQVVASVSEEVNESIDRLFPEELGDSPEDVEMEDRQAALWLSGDPCHVRPEREGYLQAIDTDRLMTLARDRDLVLRLPARPGAFVTETTSVVQAWPRERVDDGAERALSESIVIGRHRTLTQDAAHGIDQLVEIAVRALSPGINDPLTAISCLDRLGAILCRLAQKRFPAPCRYDERGRLRVITEVPVFEGFVDGALDLIRDNAGSSPAVLLRMMDLLEGVARETRRHEHEAIIRKHARLVREHGKQNLSGEYQIQALDEHYLRVLAALEAGAASHGILTRPA